jgi:serine protease Do
MRNWIIIIALSVASSALTFLLLYKFTNLGSAQTFQAESAYQATISEELFSGRIQQAFHSAAPTDFILASNTATPAVVSILAQVGSGSLWEKQRYAQSTGSGVLISPDGFIVTNHHVVDKSTSIKITTNDKKEYEARFVGSDPSTDLALLKIDAREMPYLLFGNSDSLQIGEWVVAVGNPFRLESTVTAGIVSAKGRNINILEADYPIESFIQTDAVVNPGNSGGALVNTLGELVGINTAIITQSGKYEGYSFAVPSNLVQKVVYDLREYGRVQRGLLGVSIANVNNEQARELLLPGVSGVLLLRVSPGGSAEEAGLKRNDVIVSVNGSETRSVPELQEIVGRFRPGDDLKVRYYRKGELNNTIVVLKNPFVTTLADIGFELRELTADEQKGLKKNGVLVVSIYKGSKIERTNMDPGFIITKVNDKEVSTVDHVIKEIRGSKKRVVLEGFYKRYPGEYYYAFSAD